MLFFFLSPKTERTWKMKIATETKTKKQDILSVKTDLMIDQNCKIQTSFNTGVEYLTLMKFLTNSSNTLLVFKLGGLTFYKKTENY